MARSKPDPEELPTLDDLEDGPAAELREMESRAERLREAADEAHDRFKRLESEYLADRDTPEAEKLEEAAEEILAGEDPDVVDQWEEKAEEARQSLKRYRALEIAHDRLTSRIEDVRRNGAADQLAEEWSDDVEANLREIGSLLGQLVDRMELQNEIRAEFAGEVGSGDAIPGFPPPSPGRRANTGSPNLVQLGRIVESSLDDWDSPV